MDPKKTDMCSSVTWCTSGKRSWSPLPIKVVSKKKMCLAFERITGRFVIKDENENSTNATRLLVQLKSSA